MVLSEVAILISTGLVIGLSAAPATTRFVASFLYGIKSNDPWTVALASLVSALGSRASRDFCPRAAPRARPDGRSSRRVAKP